MGPVEWLPALGLAFGVVFVAELGDKSQLLALALAARYRPLPVLAGIALGSALMFAVSVGVGAVLGAALPTRALNLLAGLAFVGFGLWTLRGDDEDDDEATPEVGTRSVVLTTAGALVVAELGDKTMLATITLASTNGVVGTWVGATLAMVAADALAILVGAVLGARLPERTIRIGAAVLFFLFGLALLWEGIRG